MKQELTTSLDYQDVVDAETWHFQDAKGPRYHRNFGPSYTFGRSIIYRVNNVIIHREKL